MTTSQLIHFDDQILQVSTRTRSDLRVLTARIATSMLEAEKKCRKVKGSRGVCDTCTIMFLRERQTVYLFLFGSCGAGCIAALQVASVAPPLLPFLVLSCPCSPNSNSAQ